MATHHQMEMKIKELDYANRSLKLQLAQILEVVSKGTTLEASMVVSRMELKLAVDQSVVGEAAVAAIHKKLADALREKADELAKKAVLFEKTPPPGEGQADVIHFVGALKVI